MKKGDVIEIVEGGWTGAVYTPLISKRGRIERGALGSSCVVVSFSLEDLDLFCTLAPHRLTDMHDGDGVLLYPDQFRVIPELELIAEQAPGDARQLKEHFRQRMLE